MTNGVEYGLEEEKQESFVESKVFDPLICFGKMRIFPTATIMQSINNGLTRRKQWLYREERFRSMILLNRQTMVLSVSY